MDLPTAEEAKRVKDRLNNGAKQRSASIRGGVVVGFKKAKP
jgi:hypothetical protein